MEKAMQLMQLSYKLANSDFLNLVILVLVAGAILEIGLKVGVIPFNVTSGHVLLTILAIFYSLRGQ